MPLAVLKKLAGFNQLGLEGGAFLFRLFAQGRSVAPVAARTKAPPKRLVLAEQAEASGITLLDRFANSRTQMNCHNDHAYFGLTWKMHASTTGLGFIRACSKHFIQAACQTPSLAIAEVYFQT